MALRIRSSTSSLTIPHRKSIRRVISWNSQNTHAICYDDMLALTGNAKLRFFSASTCTPLLAQALYSHHMAHGFSLGVGHQKFFGAKSFGTVLFSMTSARSRFRLAFSTR